MARLNVRQTLMTNLVYSSEGLAARGVAVGDRIRYKGSLYTVEKIRRGRYKGPLSNRRKVIPGEPYINVRIRNTQSCSTWVHFDACEVVTAEDGALEAPRFLPRGDS